MAEPDPDPGNPGGFVLWVAIADVAHYVRPGSALDREARRRGNSTYFPDRVVPMLPDRLSGDLCSLHAASTARDCRAHGHRCARWQTQPRLPPRHHPIDRVTGLMKWCRRPWTPRAAPRAGPAVRRLSRPGAGRARRGRRWTSICRNARSCFRPRARSSLGFKDRLEAHRLIEEFMVLANVAAAETLAARRVPQVLPGARRARSAKDRSAARSAEASGFAWPRGRS